MPPATGPVLPPGVLTTTTIPALHSLPGASNTLYLDFDGHFEASWGAFHDIDIPVYDIDGDPSDFNEFEVLSMVNIWRTVAEDYAPFDIDVTTEAPENFDDTAHLRVAIGGDGAWTDGANAGISYVNLFADPIPNVVFVFADNLGNGNARLVAECVSHESGHAFGLEHQSLYDDDGNLIDEYNPGNLLRAPIMGDSYASQRGVWWRGPSDESASQLQDDMSILGAALGWREDDVGDTVDSGQDLAVQHALVSGGGIIGTMDDVDVWSFDTDDGAIMFHVAVPFGINNLDAKAQLLDAEGDVIVAWQDLELSQDVTLVTTVASGSYRLVVGSHGAYGDVGQYTISGIIVPPGSVVTPPTDLGIDIVSPTEADLTWLDNADDETGYMVEYSLDGLLWTPLAGLDADATEFAAAGLQPGTLYYYHVVALNDVAAPAYSNVVFAETPPPIPAAPTDLVATPVAFDQINLAWSDNADNEAGYILERSDDGASWSLVAYLPADSAAYRDGDLTESTVYSYRVVAVNGVSVSALSNVASAETLPATPTAPNALAVALATASAVQLTWTDHADNESGYVVERVVPGSQWITVAMLAADTTTWLDTGLQAAASYLYRVHAVNDGVASDLSNVIRAVTLPLPPAAPVLRAAAVFRSRLTLTWHDNSNNEAFFKVLRSRDGVNWTVAAYAGADGRAVRLRRPPRGQRHYFAVVAVNAGGESAPSNVLLIRSNTILVRAAAWSYFAGKRR